MVKASLTSLPGSLASWQRQTLGSANADSAAGTEHHHQIQMLVSGLLAPRSDSPSSNSESICKRCRLGTTMDAITSTVASPALRLTLGVRYKLYIQ